MCDITKCSAVSDIFMHAALLCHPNWNFQHDVHPLFIVETLEDKYTVFAYNVMEKYGNSF